MSGSRPRPPSSRSRRSPRGGRTSAQSATPPRALQITADCGGATGNRIRLWKTELQRLADETGLQIRVCHFPPGTSKWNKIEHRLFCHISQNWRGRPLIKLDGERDHVAPLSTGCRAEVTAATAGTIALW